MNLSAQTAIASADLTIPGMQVCAHCHKPLLVNARGRRRLYCDSTCARKAETARRLSMQCNCIFCGKTFNPKKKDRVTYCSRECAYAHKNQMAVDRELARLRQVRIVVQMVCLQCGAHVRGRRLRCDKCKKEKARAETAAKYTPARRAKNAVSKTVEPLTCRECGCVFQTVYGVTNTVFCSDDCRQKNHKRIERHKRRARMKALPCESIDPIAVFERDGWRCHICGGLTLPFLRGSIEPDAPELDHVIALANGGSHTWDNVACAHRRCNFEKGAGL